MENKDDRNEKIFEKIEKLIDEFQKIEPSINLFDNYNHRTIRVKIKVQELWRDFNLIPGRNKADVEVLSLGLKNVEVKTLNDKNKEVNIKSYFNKKYMFDKQDRIGRREYILSIDGLVFSMFHNEHLFWIFWTKDERTLNEYRKIAIEKQKKFIDYFNKAQNKKGNGGFDTINIGLSDFSDNAIWNFYYNGNIYENKTIDSIKIILGL